MVFVQVMISMCVDMLVWEYVYLWFTTALLTSWIQSI